MSDLEKVKKYYGEQMAHFCRDNFPTILEQDGLLYDILSSHFAPNKFLLVDILKDKKQLDFKNYIYSFFNYEINDVEVDKTPKELLDEAGYILYECNCEEDIQSFKKYYASNEELCTFRGGRLNSCYVFFAIKKDVDSIKREDFKTPMRQDKYGTSVISIQFSRGEVNTLSIKNRYNHTVMDPDSTFSNDLENIIAGLTKSFENEYDLNVNSNKNNFSLFGYVLANDKKFYKYNLEENNIYYCPNNIIIDNGKVITKYQQNERYIFLDCYILDLKEKKLIIYDENNIGDSFSKRLEGIEKIEISVDKETHLKEVKLKTINGNIKIKVNKCSEMISYYDDINLDIGDNFLDCNFFLEEIELQNTKKVGMYFLSRNLKLKKISMPNCEIIDAIFLKSNNSLESISLPNVKRISNNFLANNMVIKNVELPNCEYIGRFFVKSSEVIEYIDLPKVEHIDDYFMAGCSILKEFRAESLIDATDYFLQGCYVLNKIYVPNIKNIGNYFLEYNEEATEIIMPKIVKIGNNSFENNQTVTSIILPCVEEIGDAFFKRNNSLKKVSIPRVKVIGEEFLFNNNVLEELDIPEHSIVGYGYLNRHPKYTFELDDLDDNKIKYKNY